MADENKKDQEKQDQEMISIPKKQLDEILTQNEGYKDDTEKLLKVANGIIDVLGLRDEKTGQIKEEYLNGSESPMPSIIKSAMGLVKDMTQAQAPIKALREPAERRIKEQFEFIKYLTPVLKKYA